MDNKNIRSILKDALEDKIPSSQVQLWPAVKASLVAGKYPLIRPGENMNTMKLRRISRAAFITLMIAILLAFAFITPQGRAFAQSLFRFFTPAKSESFPVISEEQSRQFYATPSLAPTFELSLATVSPSNSDPVDVTAVPLPTSSNADDVLKNCKAASDTSSYPCQIALAESQLGFDIREFPVIPRGLAFLNVEVNTTLRLLTINYSVFEGGGRLIFQQGEGNRPVSKWGEVSANAIQQVEVNGNYGEFAQGQFVYRAGATSPTWEAEMSVLRLRWAEGNHWFYLEKFGDTAPIEYLDKGAMIALASSLVDSSDPQANTTFDVRYSLSIAEAEAAAGFDLLEPTILPEGFELEYARYDETYQTIYLQYSPKGQDKGVGGLLVIETPRSITGEFTGCEECPANAIEEIQVNGLTAYYWQGIFDTGNSEQPLSPPVWRADAPHYALAWATPDLIVELYYDLTEWFGGQISQSNLITIAESMK